MAMMVPDQITRGDKDTLACLGLQRLKGTETDEVKKLKKDLEAKNRMYEEESSSVAMMFMMDL